jgi:hypothetical protein
MIMKRLCFSVVLAFAGLAMLTISCGGDKKNSENGGNTSTIICTDSALVGPAGGTFELCGATLRVPEISAPKTEVEVKVERRKPEGTLPCTDEFASDMFTFRPPDLLYPHFVEITIPHNGALGRRLNVAAFDQNRWGKIESCDWSDTEISFVMDWLGSFTALRDVKSYPSSYTGLGSGTIDGTLGSENLHFDVDVPTNSGCFYESNCSSNFWSISVYADCTPDDSSSCGFIPFSARFWVDTSNNTTELTDIRVINWQYDIIQGPAATITVSSFSVDGDRVKIKGTVTGTLRGSDLTTRDFSANFDLIAEEYVWPLEGNCLP